MTPAEVKAARRALGLTQQELAGRLGVEQSTVWRWEHGRAIEHPTMLRLALAALARPD